MAELERVIQAFFIILYLLVICLSIENGKLHQGSTDLLICTLLFIEGIFYI
jgi:hypothetical protein